MVNKQVELSLLFGALGDPTRRRILEILVDGDRRMTDLGAEFRMTLAAVSKHVSVLERAGLVSRRREGRIHHLRANPPAITEAGRWIESYVQSWDHRFDAFDKDLAATRGRAREAPASKRERSTKTGRAG
jgi:DNA-binding transcriptional ArsR family regulator